MALRREQPVEQVEQTAGNLVIEEKRQEAPSSDLVMQDNEEAPVPKARNPPPGPTVEELDKHELTHVVFRSWCRHCVSGRAKENPHRRIATHEGRTPKVVLDGMFFTMYIHSPVARTFFCCTVCLHTSAHLHACSRTRMAQVHEKGVCRMSVFVLSRLLPSHVSPVSAVPVHPLRHHLSVQILAELSRPRSAGRAPLRTYIAKFGYLAKLDAHTGYEPKQSDKITFVDNDTMLIDGTDLYEISHFSKNTRENTGLFDVLSMFETSVSRSSWWFCSPNGRQRKLASGNRLLDTERERERERDRRFCDQCCIVDVKEKSTEQH